jgi:hypothetical protein
MTELPVVHGRLDPLAAPSSLARPDGPDDGFGNEPIVFLLQAGRGFVHCETKKAGNRRPF